MLVPRESRWTPAARRARAAIPYMTETSAATVPQRAFSDSEDALGQRAGRTAVIDMARQTIDELRGMATVHPPLPRRQPRLRGAPPDQIG